MQANTSPAQQSREVEGCRGSLSAVFVGTRSTFGSSLFQAFCVVLLLGEGLAALLRGSGAGGVLRHEGRRFFSHGQG